MPKLVLHDQTDFIRTCLASNSNFCNIIHAARDTYSPSAVLSLDTKKAFERLEWVNLWLVHGLALTLNLSNVRRLRTVTVLLGLLQEINPPHNFPFHVCVFKAVLFNHCYVEAENSRPGQQQQPRVVSVDKLTDSMDAKQGRHAYFCTHHPFSLPFKQHTNANTTHALLVQTGVVS